MLRVATKEGDAKEGRRRAKEGRWSLLQGRGREEAVRLREGVVSLREGASYEPEGGRALSAMREEAASRRMSCHFLSCKCSNGRDASWRIIDGCCRCHIV